MSLDLQASDLGDEVVYVDTLQEPQTGAQGALRAVLGDTTERLRECAGDCGRQLLSAHHWNQVSKEKRAHLKELNVHRKESRGCCWKCAPNAPAPDKPSWANTIPLHKRVDFPKMWEKTRNAGGSYGELAEDLGVSREHVRQTVKTLGLPEIDRRRKDSEERDLFLEEMERLVRFGQGVHAISRSFSLTEDELIEKVARLRERGLTQVRFDSYMEVAA